MAEIKKDLKTRKSVENAGRDGGEDTVREDVTHLGDPPGSIRCYLHAHRAAGVELCC
jgi:hypothetical protein